MSTALRLLALLLFGDARRARATPARSTPARPLAPVSVTAGTGDAVANALDACRARCGDEAFAPVCAANGAATYANKCWANCAFASGLLGSGARVNFVVDGACANPTRFRNPSFACATACAQVYEPVCGENGVSYSNGCIAECSGVRYVRGSCHA